MDNTAPIISPVVFNLLDFFSKYDNWQDKKALFKKLDQFIGNNFKADPLLIYSHLYIESKEKSSFRCLWNKESLKSHYDETSMQKIKDIITSIDIKKKRWISKKVLFGQYYIFYGGGQENMYQIGVFRGTAFDEAPDVLNALVNFLENINNKFNEWKDIQQQNSLIYMDDLTGLFNQRKLYIDMEDSHRQYKEYNHKFCVFFIDIDHFKSINDHNGHIQGSRILYQLGMHIKRIMRDEDLIYRYGGDEFVVIIGNIEKDECETVANRLLKKIKEKDFDVGKGKKYKLSVSIGVALFPDDTSNTDDILEMADQMMYQAKNSGRGKVCFMRDMFKKT